MTVDRIPRSWTMADKTRTCFRPYGSEGWGFESLRARFQSRSFSLVRATFRDHQSPSRSALTPQLTTVVRDQKVGGFER